MLKGMLSNSRVISVAHSERRPINQITAYHIFPKSEILSADTGTYFYHQKSVHSGVPTMNSRPRSPYLVCRQFHFQGMPGRTIGTRPATLQDLDALAVLAQSAYERYKDGAGHGIYQFCWNNLQHPTVIYKDDLESAFRDENKQIYVLEDTSPPDHELLAAAIIVFQYDAEDGWEKLGDSKTYGPEYVRWLHYHSEISQMERE